jgi:phosphonate degradation associated HDIG domain protein
VTTIDDVLALYEAWGHEHYDEEVGQLAHALQTAAHAEAAGAGDALVAAALLHDVGHLLDLQGGAPGPHERTGPAWLAGLFPPAVTDPIALHVTAKRYLCAVTPEYAGGLSPGSVRSLARQGGPLTPDEATSFSALPGAAGAIALRRWDDAGKSLDAAPPPLAHYEPLLRALAR